MLIVTHAHPRTSTARPRSGAVIPVADVTSSSATTASPAGSAPSRISPPTPAYDTVLPGHGPPAGSEVCGELSACGNQYLF